MELEIQKALIEFGETKLAAEALIKKFENEKLKLSQFQTLATFFLNAKLYSELFNFILRKLTDGSKIPWAHFAEAIYLFVGEVPQEVQKALFAGATKKKAIEELSRTYALDEFESELQHHRSARKKALWQLSKNKKQAWLRELELFSSQGLIEKAEVLSKRLLKFFPHDSEVNSAANELRHKKIAHFVFDKNKNKKPLTLYHYEVLDKETEQILKCLENQMAELVLKDASWTQDFVLAHLFFEYFPGSLNLLNLNSGEKSIQNRSMIWLRSEILMRGRFFCELLDYLNQLEPLVETEPESIFALYYLRAQAFWGLNEKSQAISIMKSIIEARPQYRSARSMLHIWTEDSK